MTKFADDLLRALDSIEGPNQQSIAEDFFYEEANYWNNNTPEEWKNMNVSFKLLDSYGGEGQGDSYWSVYEFTDNLTGEKVLVNFNGWYASYEGAEFTDMRIVKPVQKTITVYE